MSDKPTWSETPNIVFELMPHLSGAQLKILMLICRKTYGYHEENAKIGYNEFMEATGLARPSVHEAINWLADAGLITRQEKGNSFTYSFSHEGALLFLRNGSEIEPNSGSKSEPNIREDGSKSEPKVAENEPVQKVNQFKNLTKNGSKSEPTMVQKVNQITPTQTKKQKTKLLSSNEESEKVSKKTKAKDPPEVMERRRALKSAWIAASGYQNFIEVQANAGIKRLEQAGCTPEECAGCFEWIKSDTWWADKEVYPQTIFKKLDEYRRSLLRKANTYGSSNGKRTDSGTKDGYVDLSTYTSGRPLPPVNRIKH